MGAFFRATSPIEDHGAQPAKRSAIRGHRFLHTFFAQRPDARHYRKWPRMEAKLCFIGHRLTENRSGLNVDTRLTRISGHAAQLAALGTVRHFADRPIQASALAS